MGRKVGGCCTPFRRGELGLQLAQYGLGRGLYLLSGILIHPTVWPQFTNVTDRQTRQNDRQDGTDNAPIA